MKTANQTERTRYSWAAITAALIVVLSVTCLAICMQDGFVLSNKIPKSAGPSGQDVWTKIYQAAESDASVIQP